MNQSDRTREQVSRVYAQAVTTPPPVSPCCPAKPSQKGAAVKLAGYDRADLDTLPPDAVINSFGCGNPMAYSGARAGETVLDLGCGAGIDLILAARRVGPTGCVIGVDMTEAMIIRARATIAAAGLSNVDVRRGLIEDLPVESASVDWVISNCVINLSPEKDRVFAEIARVLKPGGHMLVSDIVARDLPRAVLDSLELYCSCLAGAIDENAYCDGLRRAGLADVEIRQRLVYDAAQLEGIVTAAVDHSGSNGCCGPGGAPSATCCTAAVHELAAACANKVWSATVYARKPD